MDQLSRFGKRELICLLFLLVIMWFLFGESSSSSWCLGWAASFYCGTCNYVVSVWKGFLFLLVLWMGCVILLCCSLSLPYIYFALGSCYDIVTLPVHFLFYDDSIM